MRRDIHNVILPVDFTLKDDVFSIVETIQGLVKRKIPVRWGLVPRTLTAGAESQAKIVYHLLETYGLSTVMKYLDAVSILPRLDSMNLIKCRQKKIANFPPLTRPLSKLQSRMRSFAVRKKFFNLQMC